MTTSKRKTVLFAVSSVIAILAVLFILFSAKPAYAGTVKPSGKTGGYTDRSNIENELSRSGSVTLKKGKTYYTDGPIRVRSNQTINATGATIICRKTMLINIPDRVKYNSIKNFTLIGGTWKYIGSDGYHGSSIKLTHGKNLKFYNVTIRHAHASGHSMELVSCKNIVISGCDIAPLGSSSSKTEESIQLDVATHSTAYFLESSPFNGSIARKLQNGVGCKNVTIENCTIVGNRGVVANYTRGSGGKYLRRLHKNITLRNNTIVGLRGEGVALFNTKTATVTGNTIKSFAAGSSSAYTIGLHFACFGYNSKLSTGKITVTNNVIAGGRQALQVYSHTSSKYGTVTIRKNKLYCKNGKSAALKVRSSQCVSLNKGKNKTYSWNAA